MAVDRSKFRTCQQTSFCRRHRQHADATPHNSHVLYQYQVVPDSIVFHGVSGEPPAVGGGQAEQHDAAAADDHHHHHSSSKPNVWKSLQRRFLGSKSNDDDDDNDSHHQRLPPTMTAQLENIKAENDDNKFLYLELTALTDGMTRLRITEVEGQKGTAYEHPRVTYDHLVLETNTIQAATAVEWYQPGQQGAAVPSWLSLAARDDANNVAGLKFGDDDDDSTTEVVVVVQLQLNPFVLSVYRQGQAVVQMNGQDLMHFEIRKFRQQDKAERDVVEESDKKHEEEEAAEAAAAGNLDKEIVGYWEDGLAIYADGTREERKDDGKQTAEEEEEEEEVLEHRKLTEAPLDLEGLWEESFGSHQDSKPHGPMSVGLDISFLQSQHLYGIPEHASSAVLQTTRGTGAYYKEPYRLYNLDVFEYELDETMALYGSIPFVVSQSAQTGTVGVFWFNPTETFVDVVQQQNDNNQVQSTSTHWISESGVIDVFVLPGPNPASVYQQYAKLTGTTPLPPMFSLGYHQCRWNYKDEQDVYYVHGMFEELDYPYDVLWLDIEHTDGKRYFTWDDALFPNPKEMQQKLASQGRRMVTIIDPHIKRDNNYYIHKEATAKKLYIKDKDGKNDFDGWCWPGSSSYLDFTASHVRSWWADQFQYHKYQGSTPTLFTWNDMNEPSVFNGPEVSMSKDLKNLKGEEHREWHNLYGMLFQRATAEGLIGRNKPNEDVRPFVLSRAFFAGSQRYGAIWTGDNAADWGHMEVAAPMLLSMNAAALTFVGADVGGFFGNPDAELFTRWMQAGAYQPFFRGHAHHDSKRREPWMFDDDTLRRLRRAAMARYALLPFWYTVFHEAEVTGMPVMRMMWMEYPKTAVLFSVDDQYLIGRDLLVKPVTSEGATTTTVLFPTDDIWYGADSLTVVSNNIKTGAVDPKEVPADLDTIPVYQRGGSILPRKLRLRRSSMLMKHDPYTLYVALDSNRKAEGALYMDDEESFGYQQRFEFANSTFTADFSQSRTGTISSTVSIGSGWVDFVDSLATDRMIERIIVMGVSRSPKTITCEGKVIEFTFNAKSKLLVLRKPGLSAMSEWTIGFDF